MSSSGPPGKPGPPGDPTVKMVGWFYYCPRCREHYLTRLGCTKECEFCERVGDYVGMAWCKEGSILVWSDQSVT